VKKDYDVCGCDRGVRWRKIISVAKLACREWCSLPLGTVGLIEVTGVGSGLPNRHPLWKNLPSSGTENGIVGNYLKKGSSFPTEVVIIDGLSWGMVPRSSILLKAWACPVSLGRNGPIRITSFESSRCRSESSTFGSEDLISWCRWVRVWVPVTQVFRE